MPAAAKRAGVAKHFDEIVGDGIARWIAVVDRRPALVAGILGLITAALALYAATHLGVNSDPDAMISGELPFRRLEREYRRTFRTVDDAILVVVDGDSATTAGRAADALAERLRADPERFPRVDLPGGGEFFERNALLYLDVPELERFSDRLAAVQPFLAELGQDTSLVGISDLLGKALDVRARGSDVGLDLAAAFDRLSLAAEAAKAGRAAPDPWGDALIGGSMSEEARHRVVWVEPARHFDALLYAEGAVDAIRRAADELELDPDHGVHVRITGNTVLNYEELKVVSVQGKLVGVVSFALFTFAVFFALRSVRTVLALCGSLLVSVLWTNAFAAFAIGHLNQVSAVFNVLIIGLGGEFGIHVCMRYAELLAKGRDRVSALTETGASIGSSLFSSAVTTAIGFLVFLPTDYRGVAELGFISGAGMVISLFSSLTVLPALLCLGGEPRPGAPPVDLPAVARLRHVPLTFARGIRLAALAVALACAVLVPRIGFDHNPVNLRDPTTESVQTMQDLLSRSGSSPWTIDVIAKDLAEADATAERIRALPMVDRALTATDYVPADQDAKRAILSEAALFLPPQGPPPPAPHPAREREALGRLGAALATLESNGDAALATSAKRLHAALAPFADPATDVARLRANVVGSLPDQLATLRRALDAGPVTLADLPESLRASMLAADGRARIQVRSKEDLSQSDALERFVDAVRTEASDVTGGAVSLVEWGRVTSSAMTQALGTGVVCMIAFLLLLWRDVWDTILAFFPLALAAGVTVAAMVVAGQAFNFANVIVLPMLIGMGVDNGVHLVHRHRTEPDEEDVLHTSTARAVFFSATTTVLSFGSLGFASHRGMAAIGQILTLGVAATFVCYVVVLPAVLEWDDRRRRARAAPPTTTA